jgi:hypothetical protein
MNRREFVESTAASIALSPLSQIDTEPSEQDNNEDVEILLRMSRSRLERLREQGEVYQVERGIWMFIEEEHSEYGGEKE